MIIVVLAVVVVVGVVTIGKSVILFVVEISLITTHKTDRRIEKTKNNFILSNLNDDSTLEEYN